MGTDRKEEKKRDCSGRMKGRTKVPKRSMIGVVLRAERYSWLQLVSLMENDCLGLRGSEICSDEPSAVTRI